MRAGRFCSILVVPAAITIPSLSYERRPEGHCCGASQGRRRQHEWQHQVRLHFFFSSFSRIFICFVLCALSVSSPQQWKD